jgi:hypothetical protein
MLHNDVATPHNAIDTGGNVIAMNVKDVVSPRNNVVMRRNDVCMDVNAIVTLVNAVAVPRNNGAIAHNNLASSRRTPFQSNNAAECINDAIVSSDEICLHILQASDQSRTLRDVSDERPSGRHPRPSVRPAHRAHL